MKTVSGLSVHGEASVFAWEMVLLQMESGLFLCFCDVKIQNCF